MCGKCAEHHAPRRPSSKTRKKPRLSSAKPKLQAVDMFSPDIDAHYCPVHGPKDWRYEQDETGTDADETRRVASRDNLQNMVIHRPDCENYSENYDTEKAY